MKLHLKLPSLPALRSLLLGVFGCGTLLLFMGSNCTHTRQVRLNYVNVPDALPGQLAGASFSFQMQVNNSGNKGSGVFTITAYLSTDAAFDPAVDVNTFEPGTDLVIGQSALQPGVGAGATDTVTVTATVPTGLPAGEYFIFANIDGKTVTSMVFPVLISGSTPDFTVEGLALNQTLVQRGAAIEVTWNVTNLGGGTGTVKNGFFLGLSPTYSGSDTSLNMDCAPNYSPGSSIQKTSLITIPGSLPVGQYYLILMANYDAAVTELDHFNNQIAVPIFVSANAGIDYVVGNNVLDVSNVVAAQGTTFSVSVPCANAGVIDATTGVELGAYLMTGPTLADPSGILVGATSVPTLLANSTYTANFNIVIPPGLPTGQYYLGYYIDDLNFQPESDESNNGSPTYLINVVADDIYENNDTQATATIITKNTVYTGLISALNDDDWYRITVGGFSNQISGVLTNNAPSGQLGVSIYNGAGTDIGDGTVTAAGWTSTITELPAGNYYFRIFHEPSDTDYTTPYAFAAYSIEQSAVLISATSDLAVNGTLGTTDTYTVALSRAPSAGETVTVTFGYDNTQLNVSPTPSISFDNTNYTTPQTITVGAPAAGTPGQYTITHTVSTTGGIYTGATAGSVKVDVSD
ncbi:MAG: CARDB domain-containing protein [Planctomycetota bacterium]